MSASERSGWQRAGRFAGIVSLFLLVGPAVGLVTFAACIAVYGVLTGKPGDLVATALVVLLYGSVFAHFMGMIPATITGVAVAALAAIRQASVPVWVGAVAGAAASAFVLSDIVFKQSVSETAELIVWSLLICGAVAGAACTRLSRRWQG